MQANDVAAFGRWLQQRRRALALTRHELARQAGCSIETIRELEAGVRRPSKEMAALLAGCLKVAPEEQAAFVNYVCEAAAR